MNLLLIRVFVAYAMSDKFVPEMQLKSIQQQLIELYC